MTGDNTIYAVFDKIQTFKVLNNGAPGPGSGGDHGYITVIYNGQTENLDAKQSHTFEYSGNPNDKVKVVFNADIGYEFERYVEQVHGPRTDNPAYFTTTDYMGHGNETIDIHPQWKLCTYYDVTFVPGTPRKFNGSGSGKSVRNQERVCDGSRDNGYRPRKLPVCRMGQTVRPDHREHNDNGDI